MQECLPGTTCLSDLPDALLLHIIQCTDVRSFLNLKASNKRLDALCTEIRGAQVQLLHAYGNGLHAVVSGCWKDALFLSALERQKRPSSHKSTTGCQHDYSAFWVPDASGNTTTTFVTDGLRSQLLDSTWQATQGHIPPTFQRSPHRPQQVLRPVPVGSISDLQHLQLLLLQPVLHGPQHVRQQQYYRHLYSGSGLDTTWPPVTHVNAPQKMCRLVIQQHAETLDHMHYRTCQATAGSSSRMFQLHEACTPSSGGVIENEAAEDSSNERNDGGMKAAVAGVALVLPRAPFLELTSTTSSSKHGASTSGDTPPSSSSSSSSSSSTTRNASSCREYHDGAVNPHSLPLSSRLATPQHAEYAELDDLATQMLSKSLSLDNITYLDLSYHTQLQDNSLSLVLRRLGPTLQHAVLRGTNAGPLCFMLLGTNGLLQLKTLDLSYSLTFPANHSTIQPQSLSISSRTSKSHRHRSLSRSGGVQKPSSSSSQGANHTHSRAAAAHTNGNAVTVGSKALPAVSVVTGQVCQEEGLRHRFPSQLQTSSPNRAAIRDTSSLNLHDSTRSTLIRGGTSGSSSVLPITTEPAQEFVGQAEDVAAAAALPGSGMKLCVRLLKSALTRMTQLTDLNLAGNDLTGLFNIPMASSLNEHNTSSAQNQKDAFTQTIQRLRDLDVSHSSGMTYSEFTQLLCHATAIRHIYAHGCTYLAETAEVMHRQDHTETIDRQQQQDCKLQDVASSNGKYLRLSTLSCGWGFSGPLISSICASSSTSLATLHIGIGASVDDKLLQRVAEALPLLQELRLQMAAVGDAGMRAVLTHCRRLHVLSLEQCLGPFAPAMLPVAPSCYQGNLHRSEDPASQIHRWTLTELILTGPPVFLNDSHVKQLIGSRQNTLHTLALSDCRLATPGLLSFIAKTHGDSMRHLKLESYGGGVACLNGCTSEHTSSVATPSGVATWKLSQQTLLSTLALMPHLQSLHVRHSCMLDKSFVEEVTEICPLLSHLTLDQCDLQDRGVAISQHPYSPLQQVHVYKCRTVEPALLPQVPQADSSPHDLACTGKAACKDATVNGSYQSDSLIARLKRRVTTEMLVHDLLEGRTTILPVG